MQAPESTELLTQVVVQVAVDIVLLRHLVEVALLLYVI
jgi:hypothetical protein